MVDRDEEETGPSPNEWNEWKGHPYRDRIYGPSLVALVDIEACECATGPRSGESQCTIPYKLGTAQGVMP